MIYLTFAKVNLAHETKQTMSSWELVLAQVVLLVHSHGIACSRECNELRISYGERIVVILKGHKTQIKTLNHKEHLKNFVVTPLAVDGASFPPAIL